MMNKLISLRWLLVWLPVQLGAQSTLSTYSVPYLTATAYSQFQNDAFAFTGNTATLVNHTTTVAGIYGERRFLLKELAWYKAAAIFPTPLGNVG
ncbi:MAG: hypothetical protein ACOYKE_15610, partial [Ferruginibacter sp.]